MALYRELCRAAGRSDCDVPLGPADRPDPTIAAACEILGYSVGLYGGRSPSLGMSKVPQQGIPPHARQTLNYIKDKGSTPPGYKGGRNFQNDGRGGGQVLPRTDSAGNKISYREYDVRPYSRGTNRGAERIVRGSDNSSYYTLDHYDSFVKID